MPQLIPGFQREARRALLWIVIGGYGLALAFGIIGIILLFRGGAAQSDIQIFGQTIKTGSVGVACIAIAAIMVVLLTRRASASYDTSQKLLHDNLDYIIRGERMASNRWPDVRTGEMLAEHLKRMSRAEGAALKALWKHVRNLEAKSRIKVPDELFDTLENEDSRELLSSSLQGNDFVTYATTEEGSGYYLYKDVVPLIRSDPRVQQLILRFPDLTNLSQDDIDNMYNYES
jgi:hypothetical protein